MSRSSFLLSSLVFLLLTFLLHSLCLVRAAGEAAPGWVEEYPQDLGFYETVPVPAHRYSHTAIDDSSRERMVVCLGYFYDHRNHMPVWLNDVWGFSYRTRTWTILHTGSSSFAPSPRYGHSAHVYNKGQSMLVFGGDGPPAELDGPSFRFKGLWSFDLQEHTWRCLGGETTISSPATTGPWPAERSMHAAAVLEVENEQTGEAAEVLVVYGGVNKEDTWTVDLAHPTAWTKHQGSKTPGVRHGAAAVGYRGRMYVHGGGTVMPVTLYDDLWCFSLGEGWQRLHAGRNSVDSSRGVVTPATALHPWPSARSYHPAALLLGGDGPRMVIFGGANCTGSCLCLNDVWIWRLDTLEAGTNEQKDVKEKDHQLQQQQQKTTKPTEKPVEQIDGQEPHWERIRVSVNLDTRYHHSLVAHRGAIYTFGGESYSPRYMYHNSVSRLQVDETEAGAGTGEMVVGTVLVMAAGVMVAAVAAWCFVTMKARAPRATSGGSSSGSRVKSTKRQD